MFPMSRIRWSSAQEKHSAAMDPLLRFHWLEVREVRLEPNMLNPMCFHMPPPFSCVSPYNAKMKQRITYFVQQGTPLDLKDIQVEPDGINYSASQPPFIEKRVTAGLSELPEEVWVHYSHLFRLVSGRPLM